MKLLLPEGFIRTGGDYADLVSTALSPSNSFVRYTVTGYFTQVGAESTFRLLRSHSDADQTSLFVEKARVSLTLVNSAEPVGNRQARASAGNPANGNYEGHFDGANCDNFWGWVYDRNNPNTPITVEVVANGQVVGSFTASEYRQDLQNAGKGNGQHSFNFAPPASIKNNQNQSISLRVQGSSFTLEQGPRTIQCAGSGSSGGTTPPPTNPGTTTPPPSTNPSNGNYEGNFEGADCGNLGGWVYDRNNPNAPITVEVVANGQVVGSFSAANFRQDLVNAGKGNGQHGFNFAPPESVKNGQSQSISLRVQGSSYTLNNSPKTIQCAGSGSSGGTGSNPGTSTPETGNCSVGNPKGHLDNATMYSVGGWALDENNLNKTVLVDIFIDGLKLATVEANEDRPDLVGAFGNNPAARYHGFSAEFGLSGVGNGLGTITTRICGSTSDLPTSINSQVNFRSDFIINPHLFPLTIDGGTLKVFVLIKAKRPSEGDAGGPTVPAGPAVGVGGPSTAGGSGSGENGSKPKPTFKPKEKQCETYNSMWYNSLDFNGDPVVELLALLTDKGILVMPTSGRTCSGAYVSNDVSSSRTDYFGNFVDVTDINGNLKTYYDLCDGTRVEVYGVIHTHPSTNIGNLFAPSPKDLKFADTYENVAHYIIAKDGIFQFDKNKNVNKKVDRANMKNCSLY